MRRRFLRTDTPGFNLNDISDPGVIADHRYNRLHSEFSANWDRFSSRRALQLATGVFRPRIN
jgi:hypothetical protein